MQRSTTTREEKGILEVLSCGSCYQENILVMYDTRSMEKVFLIRSRCTTMMQYFVYLHIGVQFEIL